MRCMWCLPWLPDLPTRATDLSTCVAALFWDARSVYESRGPSSWLPLVELRLLWVFYTCCLVYPYVVFLFYGGFYYFNCGWYCCSLLGGLVVSFCGAFAVSTCGVLVVFVSAVDNILFVVYTLEKLSFSPYDKDQTLEV
jgi:hypothetical protein